MLLAVALIFILCFGLLVWYFLYSYYGYLDETFISIGVTQLIGKGDFLGRVSPILASNQLRPLRKQ